MRCNKSSPNMLQQPWSTSTGASPSPYRHFTPIVPLLYLHGGASASPWHPVKLRQGAASRGTATTGSAPACSEAGGPLLPIPAASTLSRGSPGWRCTREAGRCWEHERVLAVLWPALPAGREGNWDTVEILRVCQPGTIHPAGSPAQAPVNDGAAEDMQLSWGQGAHSAPGPA